METLGTYFNINHKKLCAIDDNTLKAAINKCKRHIEYKLRQRTLYGAHTTTNLGEDPVQFYVEDAIDAIISGRWEWKDKFNLADQLIRISESKISTEVEKSQTIKAKSLNIEFFDPKSELYKFELSDSTDDIEIKARCEKEIDIIESTIKEDSELIYLFDCIKAGYKRSDISEIMEITPRKYDKLIEKLKEKVFKSNSFKNYMI